MTQPQVHQSRMSNAVKRGSRDRQGRFLNGRPKTYVPSDDYYGWEPEETYLLRSRVRGYIGITERFSFTHGQAIAMPMRPDATEAQKLARGERLGRMAQNDGVYIVYKYGEEPPASQEPMWVGQEDPTAVVDSGDTGEDTHAWAASMRARPPVVMPVEGPTPAGRTSRELAAALPRSEFDTGESRMPPVVVPDALPRPPQWDPVPSGEDERE